MPEEGGFGGADSRFVWGEDEQAFFYPVVYCLAAYFEVACEFGFFHFGVECRHLVKSGDAVFCYSDFAYGYVDEVVQCNVFIAFVGEWLEELEESVRIEADSEQGSEYLDRFCVCWHSRLFFQVFVKETSY